MTFFDARKFLCVLGIVGALGATARAGEPRGSDELGKFRNTYYYVVLEADYAHLVADAAVRDMRGKVLATVSTAFKKATDIEGTGKLIDGRVINYAGRIEGETRYHVVKEEFGLGVGDCALVPFHTIAVDRTRIPLGSLVRIEETVGMILPDGSRHDGLWRAEDVGGAIKKDRIDLFIGTLHGAKVLKAAGITHLKPLTVRLVSPPGQDSCVSHRVPDYSSE